MDGIYGLLALDGEEAVDTGLDGLLGVVELLGGDIRLGLGKLVGEVVADRDRQHEVAVREALHQRGSAEAVAAVVGEVGLADGVEARDGGLQVVVDPDAAHRVVDGGIDHHRLLPRGARGDLLVHEEVAVTLGDALVAEALDGVREVKIDGLAGLVDAEAGVAALLGGTGSHVARDEVAEGRVAALEIVVAVLLRDLGGLDLMLAELLHILQLLGHPDTAVVTQGLAHQGELALLVAVDRDTGRVDLREARVAEEGALAVALHRGGAVAVHGVGGEEIGIAVAARRDHDGVGAEALQLAGDEVAGDDALGLAVDDHQVEHLMTRVGLDAAVGNLLVQGSIRTQEELLAGLALGVERTAHLHAAEGAVGEVSAVFTGERNALRDALVDDGGAHLGQTVDVGLAGAVVTTLDGVVEQTIDRVVVILIVLGSVDTALRSDGVRPARTVADAENLDVVAEFAQGGGCRRAAETGTDHDDLKLSLVVGTHETDFRLAPGPFALKGSCRNFGI